MVVQVSAIDSFQGRGRRPSAPMDLREAGRPDDPLFARPLVHGRIDTGVVERRRLGSDEIEVYHVLAKREGESKVNVAERSEKLLEGQMVSKVSDEASTRRGVRRTAQRKTQLAEIGDRIERLEGYLRNLESSIAELVRRIDAVEQRPGAEIDVTRELLRLLELAIAGERRRTA